MMKDRSNVSGTISQTVPFEPSTLETIDYAVYDWLDKELDIFSTTNKGFEKVPVIWVAAERSRQVKNNKNLRDKSGALIFPIITLQRDGFTKDLTKKGMFFGNMDPYPDKKGGSVTVARRINQSKTANFLNADSYRKRTGIAGNAGAVGGQQINFPSKKDNKKADATKKADAAKKDDKKADAAKKGDKKADAAKKDDKKAANPNSPDA